MFRKRMNLRFILQFAEWMRKYNPVVILFERTARGLGGKGLFLTVALRGKESGPIHECELRNYRGQVLRSPLVDVETARYYSFSTKPRPTTAARIKTRSG